MKPREVVVVGGGVTGLAAAYHLQKGAAKDGVDLRITLFEATDALGGKVGTEIVDDILLDTGPDSFMAQKPWAVDLCKEMGMGDDVIAPLTRRFYLLIRGKLHSVPHELVSLVPTKPEALWRASFLSLFGKLRASSEGLIRSRRDVEDESLASFMRRRFGSEFALRFAEPLMGGVHAGHPEQMSMAAVYPMYWQMELKHGSVTRAIWERRKAMKKAGGSQPSAPFVALRYGMSSMVDRLRRELGGVEVVTGSPVESLEPLPSGEVRVTATGREAIDAVAVILTTPSFVSADLIAPFLPNAAENLRKIRFASTAVVSLAYRREDVADPLDGSGFLVPRNEPSAITGCTWSSNKWEGRAPSGTVLMRAFMGHDGDDRLVEELSEEELADRAHEALAGVLGIKARPTFSRTFRWGRSMPQYDVGHLGLVAGIESELQRFPAVSISGSSYRGVGVPDCVRQGKESAEAVLGRLTGGQARSAVVAAEAAGAEDMEPISESVGKSTHFRIGE